MSIYVSLFYCEQTCIVVFKVTEPQYSLIKITSTSTGLITGLV